MKTTSMIGALLVLLGAQRQAQEWAQWGGSPSRDATSTASGLPAEWEVGKFDYRSGKWLADSAENVRWVARLGSESYGSPVIAGGKVFCATNNGAAYIARYPADVDLGCLLAFDQADGRFLWQHSVEKLKEGREIDYPDQGICSSPLVEQDRLWLVTNRCEVVCLDTEGFLDGENDGPITDEASTERDESDVVWRYDMIGQLGVVPRYMANCSVTAAGNLLFVGTSNGADGSADEVPAPQAPSFLALDKRTGELIWTDNSPGKNLLDGQWSSPALAELDGVPQVIFAGGDGWVYSFLASRGDSGKPELLWKFDCNPKTSVWIGGGRGDRNTIVSTPVISDGRVYVATGQDPEAGEGQGDLWCIDPTRRGDTSAELVVDRNGDPVPPRRKTAVDPEAGEKVLPNPNSAVIWHYRGNDANGDGEFEFEETMHRALGMPAIQGGLLVIGDYSGLVHCLDAKSGKALWAYDALATIWGSPLVADGKIYLGDEDGEVAVFKLSSELEVLAENNVGDSVYSTPIAVGRTLYVATRSHLIAIEAE